MSVFFLNKRTFLAFCLGLLMVTFLPFPYVYAIVYQPGETLDPACLPTDITCSVATSTVNSVGHFVPDAGSTYDLGASTTPWRTLYLATSTLYLGVTPISLSGGLLTVDGVSVLTETSTSSVENLTVGTSTVALSLSGFNKNNYLTLADWFATTTHSGITLLPSLFITESQISDLQNYLTVSDWNATTTDALVEGINNLYFTDARTRNALSSNALGLLYSTTTGTFSLGSGYIIPLTASTTNWNDFYDTPSIRVIAGNGLSWSGNTLNATPVATTTNVLSSGNNTLTSNVDGVIATTTIVNTNMLSTSTNTFSTIVNGVSSATTSVVQSLTNTTNSNTLTININGVSATSTLVNTNALSWSGNTISSTINGVLTSVLVPYANEVTDGLISTTTQTITGNKLFNDNIGIGITPNERLTVSGIVALGEQAQTIQASSTVGFGKLYVKQATGSGIDKYVSLLLHADGVDGSTTLTDSSNEQNAFAINGSAQLSTANPKFGTAALSLDGTTDYVTIQSSVAFDMLDSQPFTIDMWVYATSIAGSQSLVEYSSSNNNRYQLYLNAGVPTWEFNIGGGGPDISIVSNAGALATNTWTHIAMRRVWDGATYTYALFVDGTSVGSASNSTAQSTFTNNFAIGASVRGGSATDFFTGYIDELRISQNSNRYSDTSFLPETSPYGTGLFYQLANGSLVELAGGGAGGSGSTLDVNAFHKNGDAFGATSTVGTLDAYGLQFMTGGVTRALFDADGSFVVYGGASFAGTTTLSHTLVNDGLTIASSSPSATTNTLYNQGGTLYWNGEAVGGSLVGGTGETVTFDGSGNPISTNALFINGSNIGIGTLSPSAELTVAGSILLEGSARYLNFGTTTGATGYGLRDKNGVLEFKNLDGVWTAIGTSTVGAGSSTPLTGAEGNILTFDIFGDPLATSSIFISSDGFFGIGTTTPNNRLSVLGGITIASSTPNTSANSLYNQSNTLFWNGTKVRQGDDLTGAEGFVMSFDSAGLQVATSSIFIAGGGNVGIGTTSPTTRLSVAGDISLVGSTTSAIGFDGALSFRQGTTDRMIIDSAGLVGIGTTTPVRQLHIFRDTTDAVLRIQDSNAICDISPSNGALNCSSDQTLKKNIESLDSSLDTVLQLRSVVFDWNNEEDGTGAHVGFIAQEVEELFPGLVMTDSESGLKSVSYTNFIPIIVQSIQEIANIGGSFKNNLISWLGDAQNDITSLFAKRVETEELCIGEVCITEERWQELLNEKGINVQRSSNEEVAQGVIGVVVEKTTVSDTDTSAIATSTPLGTSTPTSTTASNSTKSNVATSTEDMGEVDDGEMIDEKEEVASEENGDQIEVEEQEEKEKEENIKEEEKETKTDIETTGE